MSTLNATQFAPLLNAYTIVDASPKRIVVPNASKLTSLQDVTVNGTLLKKQLLTLNRQSNQRSARLAAGQGKYGAEAGDGDLHFCLGVKQLQPHIACELQNAKAFVPLFNQSIGAKIAVSGFFRCMFEHPGFRSNDDAHIFEIHPVRAVSIGGALHSFDVDIPEQSAIHTWTSPHPLNQQDNRIQVAYDKAKDTLTFSNMDGQDENYVQVSGKITQVKLNAASSRPASFTFDSQEIGHTVQGHCLQGTSAARQLRALAAPADVSIIALRNIDLAQALKNRYVISLLAIDIKPAAATGLTVKQR